MRKIALMIVSIAVLMATFFTTPALAGVGVAMGPTTLEIPSALRGVEYQRTVAVFNPGNTEMDFSLRADGQASEWLSFYDWSTKAAIQDLTLAGLGNDYVLIGINIPSDAPNGTYTTTIYVESAPIENAGEMEIAAVMQASSVLTIQVSGDQIVSGEISSMSIKDTEIGLPVRLDVNFFNTGNIVVYPKIDWVISKDDTKLVELSYAETMVKPEAHAVIPVEWTDATDMKGDYSAQVTVSLDGKVITTEEISFKILSVGTLTKLGALSSLAYEGQAELGNMLKIQGSFNSTGQADTLAKLIAEIYYNDNLIDTIMSEQILVPAGQTGMLSAYFKPSDSGAYIVKGYASYDGKQTGMKEISFTIEPAPPPTQYTLTIKTQGQGTATGGGTYEKGESLDITATAADGWEFIGWTGDTGGMFNMSSQESTVSMEGDYTLIANFSQIPIPTHVLTINTNGSGKASGTGIYEKGQVAHITATPGNNWEFVSWTGDISTCDDPSAENTNLTVDDSYSITANFALKAQSGFPMGMIGVIIGVVVFLSLAVVFTIRQLGKRKTKINTRVIV